jgi:hypothetical protein
MCRPSAMPDIVHPPTINSENLRCHKPRLRRCQESHRIDNIVRPPVRPTMVRSLMLRTRTWNSSSLRPVRAISVTIHPGATALTVTPRRPSSIAKRRVKINTSALVAA